MKVSTNRVYCSHVSHQWLTVLYQNIVRDNAERGLRFRAYFLIFEAKKMRLVFSANPRAISNGSQTTRAMK